MRRYRWAFSIRVEERDIERLDELLAGVNDATVRRMQEALASVWRLFTYDVPAFPSLGPPQRGGQGSPSAAPLSPKENNSTELQSPEWVIGDRFPHDDGGGGGGGGGGGRRGKKSDGPRGGGAADLGGVDAVIFKGGGTRTDTGTVEITSSQTATTTTDADDGTGRPKDAFDMLMTTLRYKLELRSRAEKSGKKNVKISPPRVS